METNEIDSDLSVLIIDAGLSFNGGKLVVVVIGAFVILCSDDVIADVTVVVVVCVGANVVDVPVSLAVLPRFLFANSYISPNMPANVFLKFFIVSSASSATDVCVCGGRCCVVRANDEVPDTDDVCDTCESLRPTFDNDGAFSDGCSGGSDETLLKLP